MASKEKDIKTLFYLISDNKLPYSLLSAISKIGKEHGVKTVEIWEEKIYDEQTQEIFYRQHYLDKDSKEFFAVSRKIEGISYKDKKILKLVSTYHIRSSLKKFILLKTIREKEYFDFKEIPDWLLADTYSFNNTISNISSSGLQSQYSSKHFQD